MGSVVQNAVGLLPTSGAPLLDDWRVVDGLVLLASVVLLVVGLAVDGAAPEAVTVTVLMTGTSTVTVMNFGAEVCEEVDGFVEDTAA